MTITNISVGNISQSQATFYFTLDQSCRPQIQIGTVSGQYSIKSDCQTGTEDFQCDFGGLKSQTTYYFRIKADTTFSNEQNFTTL